MQQGRNKRFDIERVLIALSFVYLLFQFALFLLGWFEPYVAIPLICWASVELVRQVAAMPPAQDVGGSRRSFFVPFCIAACVLAFFINYSAGYTGDFPQYFYDFAQRNAVYGNLCLKDWPIVLPDGREFCYYISSFLPAALICKLFQLGADSAVLMWWYILGCTLAFILAFFLHRRACLALIFVVVVLGFHDPVLHFRLLKEFALEHFSLSFNANPNYYGLFDSSAMPVNHATVTLLTTILVLNKRVSRNALPLLAAFFPPASSFGAVALLPMLFVMYLRPQATSQPSSAFACLREAAMNFLSSSAGWFALVAVACSALYYGRADGGITVVLSVQVTHGFSFTYILFKELFHILLFNALVFVPALPARKECPGIFYATLLSSLAISFVYIGEGGPNELCFKGSLPVVISASYLWMVALRHAGFRMRCLIWTCIALMIWYVLGGVITRIRTYGYNPDNVASLFNHHCYHPGTWLIRTIPPTKAAAIPGVMYTTAGESRQVLPFLPPGDATLYDRPLLPKPTDSPSAYTIPTNEDLKLIRFFD